MVRLLMEDRETEDCRIEVSMDRLEDPTTQEDRIETDPNSIKINTVKMREDPRTIIKKIIDTLETTMENRETDQEIMSKEMMVKTEEETTETLTTTREIITMVREENTDN